MKFSFYPEKELEVPSVLHYGMYKFLTMALNFDITQFSLS